MNIIDYVYENMKTFEEDSFHKVDGLVLSWLSYIRWTSEEQRVYGWEGATIAELYKGEYFKEMFDGLYEEKNTRQLFAAVAASPRYRDCVVMGYVSHFDPQEEKQFSAVTFRFREDASFVAFRGTDSTFVGWKEDFNMAFTCPVPAQEEAVRYLGQVGEHTTGELYLGGHSKGGNLAIYGAAYSEALAPRIQKVYSFDGPGFMEEIQKREAFRAIEPKIRKIVPQSSVIGMLMEENPDYQVVRSDVSGIWQHNAFSWQLKGNQFDYLPRLNQNAIVFDRTVNDWVKSLSKEERSRLIDTIYSLTKNIDAVTFAELNARGWENYSQLVLSVKNLDADSKRFILEIIKSFAKYPFQKK